MSPGAAPGRRRGHGLGPRRARRRRRRSRSAAQPSGRTRSSGVRKRGRVRAARPVAADHDRVVVAVEEGPLRAPPSAACVSSPKRFSAPTACQTWTTVVAAPVRGDVDRQVGVVDDEQAGRPEQVHAAHEPGEVARACPPGRSCRAPAARTQSTLRSARAPDPAWMCSRLPSRCGHAGGRQDDPIADGSGAGEASDAGRARRKRAGEHGIRAASIRAIRSAGGR